MGRSRTRHTYHTPVDLRISLRHLHALVSIRTAPKLPRGCEGNRSLTPVREPSHASVPHSPPWWRVVHLPSNSPRSHVSFASERPGRDFTGFNICHLMCQYGRMDIVRASPRVKVLNPGSFDGLLFMTSQLLQHSVTIRLSNVRCPRFPLSHDLSR